MITKLEPHQIFVFGSNTSGIHGRGAAKQAAQDFGAKRWVGEGLTGQCYALPTLDFVYGKLVQRSSEDLDSSVQRFLDFATAHPELEFLLTKVGCGLAGYPEDFMKSKFTTTPVNVVKPEGW